jgi:flagellar motor switch protein FliN
VSTGTLVQELIDQLTVALGGTLDAQIRSEPATPQGPVWRVTVTLPHGLAVTLAFDRAGAAELASVMSGQDEPTDDLVRKSLAELCGHVATGLAARRWPDEREEPATDVRAPELVDSPAGIEGVALAFSAATLGTPLIAIVSAREQESAEQASVPVDSAKFVPGPERLDVLLDIDLPLLVRFGCTKLPLKVLSRLGPGSLIDLSRSPEDPVELLVGERVVARGEVVVVSGSYGIRILEVVGGRDNAPRAEAR